MLQLLVNSGGGVSTQGTKYQFQNGIILFWTKTGGSSGTAS